MFTVKLQSHGFPQAVIDAMPDKDIEGAKTMAKRDDTNTIWGADGNGKAVFYAVIGWDISGEMVNLYYTDCFIVGIGKMLMKNLFGAANVNGVPLRVHVDTLRGLEAKARGMGATVVTPAKDGDGLFQGVFSIG